MSCTLFPAPNRQPVEGSTGEARSFHRKIEGYQRTPLTASPEVGANFDLPGLLLKLEVERFGLPAFKFLGASYAAYRRLESLGAIPSEWQNEHDLRDHLASSPFRLITATDGNHGRALARFAKRIGLESHVYVPTPTATARIKAIEEEGAVVTIVNDDYDAAVRVCASDAQENDVVISDTSWEGYRTTPAHVIDGYSTIFDEIDEQCAEAGFGAPTSVIVPAGVGALSAACADWLKRSDSSTRLVLVEPSTAACVTLALMAGRPVSLPDTQESSMAGLNCGTASSIALDRLLGNTAATVTVNDKQVADATRLLAANGFDVGESAAATIAALAVGTSQDTKASTVAMREVFGDRPLALLTEAPTDPENFERIVGRAPRLSGSIQ